MILIELIYEWREIRASAAVIDTKLYCACARDLDYGRVTMTTGECYIIVVTGRFSNKTQI